MNPITLFENGKDIQEGDKFVAHVSSIEGYRKVTLVPQEKEGLGKISSISGVLRGIDLSPSIAKAFIGKPFLDEKGKRIGTVISAEYIEHDKSIKFEAKMND